MIRLHPTSLVAAALAILVLAPIAGQLEAMPTPPDSRVPAHDSDVPATRSRSGQDVAQALSPKSTTSSKEADVMSRKQTIIPGRKADGRSNARGSDGRDTNGGAIVSDGPGIVESSGSIEVKGSSAQGGSGNKTTF